MKPPYANDIRRGKKLLDIHLLDLDKLLLRLRYGDNQDPILHPGSNTITLHLSRILLATELDLPLKDTHLPLIEGEFLEEFLVPESIDDTRNVQLAAIGIPVDAHILLLGARQGNVHDKGVLGVEDVRVGREVLATRAFAVVASLAAHGGRLLGREVRDEIGNLVHVETGAAHAPRTVVVGATTPTATSSATTVGAPAASTPGSASVMGASVVWTLVMMGMMGTVSMGWLLFSRWRLLGSLLVRGRRGLLLLTRRVGGTVAGRGSTVTGFWIESGKEGVVGAAAVEGGKEVHERVLLVQVA